MGYYKKMRLSLRDVKYLLFGKKVCPKCKGKLVKNEKKEFMGVGDAHIGEGHGGTTFRNVEKYNVEIFFKCSECGEEYSLEMLL